VIRRTDSFTDRETNILRTLLDRAFEGTFTDDDWEHALGGVHVLVEDDRTVLGHASVVPRALEFNGQPLATGYVEAVAIAPPWQGQGWGTRLMCEIGSVIAENYEVGALSTHSFHFYERLGWRRWVGPMSVRTQNGVFRTPDDEGSLMVLLGPAATQLDLRSPISCDWRPGDVW
jgi:aminoglycoside 2'-N-acetyltransferase I